MLACRRKYQGLSVYVCSGLSVHVSMSAADDLALIFAEPELKGTHL